MHQITRLTTTLLVLATLITAACGGTAGAPQDGDRPATLRVGLIPNQAPDKVRAQYEPFRHYLASVLGQPVETFVATDYAGVVEAMAADRLDLAYFGGFTYVQAEQRAGVSPIVTEVDRETNTPKYFSAIIVRASSPYRNTGDLKGKRFAFGDIASTSGSLYPRVMLDHAGIGSFEDPQTFVYTGGHDATLAAVINGTVEAGGIEKRIMDRAFDTGTFRREQIRVIEQTLVQGYPWVVRSKLDRTLVDRITDAFLKIDQPDLLQLMRAVRYTKVVKSDYDEIRTEARRLGLVK